ncbi:MAG: heavy metal translocating P-type ATPase [Hyphomicrobiaceae bacterium]
MAAAQVLSTPQPTGAACCASSAPTPSAVVLTIENMHCGSCMAKVERALTAVEGVASARANLSAKRVSVAIDPTRVSPVGLIDALSAAGFKAAELVRPMQDTSIAFERDLLKRIGVAGFAAANIMLLSVSVWAGLASDMGPELQSLFHWISALIAMPAVAYAGQPFFQSAASALRARRLNMDVPISVAITLATAMSLFQTTRGSSEVYFDAAVTLLFFLLIGRFLDNRVRSRAVGAAQNLLALRATRAQVIMPDGTTTDRPSAELSPGMRVLVVAGERIPADGRLRTETAEIDESLVTGETLPRAVATGDAVYAGSLNLGRPLEIEVTAADDRTLIAEIARLMEAAEQGRGRYVRLADRAARLYAPLVHLLGLTTLIGWLTLGNGWEASLTAAIAVLIITCPCALALAVPAVQVAAAQRLFRLGILVKASDGLERLAEIDTVVFDKTGTLTLGRPTLVGRERYDRSMLRRAAGLAAASRHPYARALTDAVSREPDPPSIAKNVEEVPGEGLRCSTPDGEERLGSHAFAGGQAAVADHVLWYTAPGEEPVGFSFTDDLRQDARETVEALRQAGFAVELLSGDRRERASAAAEVAGIDRWHGGCRPADKIARLRELTGEGHRVLMVGDGLNDAPALAAGHASLSPSTAVDISQTASDAVFQGEALGPVVELLGVARMQRRMALQNFAIALAYNAVSVPLAMAGLVSPLIAAIAMSTSSIAVTLNALRLGRMTCPAKASSR